MQKVVFLDEYYDKRKRVEALKRFALAIVSTNDPDPFGVFHACLNQLQALLPTEEFIATVYEYQTVAMQVQEEYTSRAVPNTVN